VLISGEGGDEAFAGYPNYRTMLWLERMKRLLGPFQGAASRTLGMIGRVISHQRAAKYLPLLSTPFESYYYSRTSTPFRFFNASYEQFYSKEFLQCINKTESLKPVMKLLTKSANDDIVGRMLYVDTKTWLPDDLLVKADKITMANSIELRVPLLDHKILEFAAALPSNFKVHGFTTKYIAKRSLSTQVPKEILGRKKAGFPVPYAKWLRTDLRDWLRGILLDRVTLSRGYFHRAAIENLLSADERSGMYSKELFSLAVLELWHREFLGMRSGSGMQPAGISPEPIATRP
jgi:asparagine synthase (glutamine-hydrolysing)